MKVDFVRQLVEVYKSGLLKKALDLVNRCPNNFVEVMDQWRKDPNNENFKAQIHGIVGGPEPKPNDK